MNKTGITVLIVVTLVIVGFIMWGGDADAPTEKEGQTSEEEVVEKEELSGDAKYEVSKEESLITWEAGKTLVVNYKDGGVLDIKSGNVVLENGLVTGATVVFDMTSIEAQDTTNTKVSVDRLTGHLKSEDFFNVGKYPEAKLVITSVVKSGDDYTATGNLTILDKTKEITFPTDIYTVEGDLVVDAVVNVDRTKYGITYGSGSFFEDLGDNVIDDNFIVNVRLIAKSVSE